MRDLAILYSLLLSAAAARADSAQWIEWAEFTRWVAERNPVLVAARESLERARHDVRAAEATWWPELAGSAGFSRSDADGSSAGPVDRTALGLEARYTLYAGGSDRARVAQARALLEQAESELREAYASVGAEARRAFVGLQFAQQRVVLAETILERRRQNLELVRLRFDSGAENKGALLRVEAAALQAEADLEQARRDLAVRQRELSGLAGREDRVAWRARGDLPMPAAPDEPDWGAAARAAPRVRAARARLAAARAAEAIALGARRPEVAARGAIDRAGDSWPPDRDGWSAAVTLTVPVFTGGRTVGRLAAARAEVRAAEARLEQETRAQELALETAYANLLDALRQVEVQEAFRKAAETRAEIARAQYANGLLSFQNWDQIEDELIQSRRNLLARARDAALAAAEWERARGRSPLPDTP
jgi:outer membrane protein TolC